VFDVFIGITVLDSDFAWLRYEFCLV
jgi:hypothetical protein